MSADLLAKLKQEVRGIILSCPRGLTINQFLKDYKDSIGRTFPFQELGYHSIPDLLYDISDVVRLHPGYGGSPSIMVPVINEKVNHINSMVSRQKTTPAKFSQRSVPRRSILDDSDSENIRRPVQLPLESRNNMAQERNAEKDSSNKPKDNSNGLNGYSGKTKSNNYENTRTYQSQNSLEEEDPSRYPVPKGKNEYQIPDNQIEMVGDYVDNRDTGLVNGMQDNIADEDFERPPTPGEIIITEKMKNNFRELLSENPEGIPSSKFCKLYHERFGVPLRYENYGMTSFQDMIICLPDVFSFRQQRSSQQWTLYDARVPNPSAETQRWIPYDISVNIGEVARDFPDGLKKDELIFLYRERFRADLDVQRLGFSSIESFLQLCPSIDLVIMNGDEVILPKNSHQTSSTGGEQSYPLPPVSEMPYLWSGHFSEDECDPSVSYQPFKLIKKDKLNYTKVFACDVISPSSIWLQMDVQREELSKLMLNLNDYYDKFEHKHTLEDNSFVVNDLICAVRFEMDNRWHRAKVISQTNSSSTVTVRYIDYGTENEVSITSIRKLLKIFYSLPVQAVQSSLYGLMPKPKDPTKLTAPAKWSDECVNFIYNLCFEKKFNLNVLEIVESIPKLQVVLFDGNNPLTINDQLLVAGHAVSVGHMGFLAKEQLPVPPDPLEETNFPFMLQESLSIKSSADDERSVRPPPGYSSRTVASPSPKNLALTSSTCVRINMLRNESVLLWKEMETLEKEIKQKLYEAEVLESMVCKHPHPHPQGFESLGSFKDKPKQLVGPPLVVQNQASPYMGCYRPPIVLPNQVPPPYMGYPPFQQPQQQPNMMFSQNMGQWGGHQWPPGGMYNSYRPEMFANAGAPLIRPVFNQPMPPNIAPVTSSLGTPPPSREIPRPSLNDLSPPIMKNLPESVPKEATPLPVKESLVASSPVSTKTSPSEEIPVDVIVPSAPPLHEVDVANSNVDFAEEVVASEDEAVEATSGEAEIQPEETVTPPSPPRLYDTSHLSEKQLKKLMKSDLPSVLSPPTNNWSDLMSTHNASSFLQNTSTDVNPSNGSQYPNQTLMDLIKEEKDTPKEEMLKEAYRNEIDEITDNLEHTKEVVNHIMKICVQNIHGLSSSMLLILVGDCVTVLLKQLYFNFWWGEHDEQSYNDIMYSLKNDLSLAYTIFYADYIPIFEQLRSDNFIESDDSYVHLVNLRDVPNALDIICPSEKRDLTEIKDMFVDLSKLVLSVDDFWYRSGNKPAFHLEFLNG